MKHEIPTDEPMEMIRAIREKRYEETKHMTRKERSAYSQKKLDEAEEIRKKINPDDYDFPFLHKKQKESR